MRTWFLTKWELRRMDHRERWIRIGVLAGVIAVVAYGALVAAPLPDRAQLVLACSFGPALVAASIGFRHFLTLQRPSVSADAALAFNAIAGAMVTAMLLVQASTGTAIRRATSPSREELAAALAAVDHVQLGLDVAWDVFVSLGTFLFALAGWRHPRLGPAFALPGMVIAGALLTLNLFSFPIPPSNAGLFDVGPLIGLWYLGVSIRIAWSRSWVQTQTG